MAQLSGSGGAEDFDELFIRLNKIVAQYSGQKIACLVKLDESHSLPNAYIRGKFSSLFHQDDIVIAIVTKNRLVNGILTALNWISQKKSLRKTFTDALEAEQWLKKALEDNERAAG